ncbi:MAG: leucine-rich repeat domain-containing protein, partial [Clostridia bacterium]|nr:leucine-rich repeat domain-containing protein [Clostridia bacterium]
MKKHITHILGLCLCVVVSLGGFLIGGEIDSFPAFKALFATKADAAEDTASYYYDGNSVIFSGEGTVKASWFRGNKDIVSVEIPVSVDYIEPYAFSGCTGLKSVRIGTGSGSGIGTTVGSYAFSNCKALESVTVLSADIGDYAFQGCSNLSDITVASCGRIGQGAFYNCSKLSLGIYDIGWVESIGADAFYGTAWYNTQSYWDNGILYYDTYLIKAKTVDGQSGKCTVKDNTVLIADSAFSNSSFASVIVPDSVRSIGNNAFSGINILAYAGNATGSPWGAKKIAKYYDDTFIYSDENKTQLEGCLENKGNIVIPNGVTGIVYRAFYDYTGITSITIPESVTSIGNLAFYGCTGLTEINYNAAYAADLTYSSNVFYNAGTAGEGINVTFGDSVEKIPESLFRKLFNSNYSPKIKSVIIGSNVTSIGNEAFNNCTALTSITIPDNVTSIGYRAFYGCTGLKTAGPIGGGYNIEFGWKELIPDSAFYECSGLTSITIPNGVTSIGEEVFLGCTG